MSNCILDGTPKPSRGDLVSQKPASWGTVPAFPATPSPCTAGAPGRADGQTAACLCLEDVTSGELAVALVMMMKLRCLGRASGTRKACSLCGAGWESVRARVPDALGSLGSQGG